MQLSEYSQRVGAIESLLLSGEQAECPLFHFFGPSLVVREVHMKAGTLAVGHRQKFQHLNILLKGKVLMFKADGTSEVVSAPLMFIGEAGRKFGYVLEDTVWQNIYASDIKTPEEFESQFIEKSEAWELSQEQLRQIHFAKREEDRLDYLKVIASVGLSDDDVRAQMQDPDTEEGCENVIVKPSAIEGVGVFVTSGVKEFGVIGPAFIDGKRTKLARFVNHAKKPNAFYACDEIGNIWLHALNDISQNEEVTADYYQALRIQGVELEDFNE